MVQGNYLITSVDIEKKGKSDSIRICNNDEARNEFLNYRRINEFVWNKLLKKSFVLNNHLFNKEGIINEDLLWTFYVLKCLNKACLLKTITYNYHIRSGSISSSTSQNKQGLSYSVIYNEILENLTQGKERGELKGYLYNFSYNYATYVSEAPELNQVLVQYKKRAKQYGCWYVLFVLSAVSITSHINSLPSILQVLNKTRLKLKENSININKLRVGC